jgi:hypothetical protein
LYANTLTSNVAFTAKGTATVTGLLTASARATVGTNLTVSGNTTLGAANKTQTSTGVWSHTGNISVSGNTTLGAANKTQSATGVWTQTGNLIVSGNTSTGKATVTNRLTVSGNTALGGANKTQSATGVWTQTGNLIVTGNTTLGAANKTQTSTGVWSHTGNMSVSANTSITKLLANNSLGTAGYVLKTNGTNVYWDAIAVTSVSGYAQLSGAAFTGAVSVSTGGFSVAAGGLTVSNGNIALAGNKLVNYTENANTYVTITAGQTINVPSNSNVVRYTVAGASTLKLPASMPNQSASVKNIIIVLKENGTGGYAVTLAAPTGETIVYNNSATQPANQTGANKVTIYQCMKFDGDTRWYVSMGFYEA